MLEVTYSGSSTTNSFATFDGNGNVSSLVNAANATTLAQYEYGPFGEVIRVTGPMAKANPFRFSTKYQDDESDLLYYGFRYYSANEGRWINRDPINEPGFILSTYFVAAFPKIRNDFSYLFVVNDCQDMIDKLGLDGWGSFPPLWNLPPQPPPPPPPAGFFMCQRNIGVDGYSDIAGRVGNCCGGMHTYLEYDDGSGGQWGWGFNGGTTTVSEQHFGGNCTSCKPTSGKLQAGSGQGTAANEATAAQIQDCIKSVKPSKPYSWYGYNCKAWAQEAAGKCGLSCK
jgi:RHS repeat-associated protein